MHNDGTLLTTHDRIISPQSVDIRDIPHLRPLSRRVVITGLGVVSCCGIGKDAFWRSVRDGITGIGRIDLFDASGLPCQIAGQVHDFDPGEFMPARKVRSQGRFAHFAVASSKLAMVDAGLDIETFNHERAGVSYGSSGAGLGNIGEQIYQTRWQQGTRQVDGTGLTEIQTHAATSHVAIELQLKGPSLSNSTGCATAVVTIGQAFDTIRSGQAEVMIAGGTEACISEFPMSLLCKLRVLTTENMDPEHACRPYDKKRGGLVLGEGGGALVMESAEHALRRGARIYGEVLGYGVACEAFHLVAALPTGEELARAIRAAMAMANTGPSELDYICSHGIGNEQYDLADTRGIKLALGDHAYRIPVSSIKPITGQPFAAAGAFQAISACMTLTTETIPPTLNLVNPDENCDLDYVPGKCRRGRVETVAINAHSFGGTHAALILRRFVV